MRSIIYIPGLAGDLFEQSVKVYAKRLMKAIDENEANEHKTFRLETLDLPYDEESTVQVATIYETKDDQEVAHSKIYEYEYGDFLTSFFRESSILKKSLLLILALIERFPRFFGSIFSIKKKSIPYKYKLQSFVFIFMYLIVVALAILTLPALLINITSFVPDEIGNIEGVGSFLKGLNVRFGSLASILTSTFAFTLLALPKVRKYIEIVAVEYLSVNYYFKYGESRLKIIGKLSRLLEFITEQHEVDQPVEIHGYSFGSVVAIDALFPYEGGANYRFKDKVKTLVTIGCPFDFIRTYWPFYFRDRPKNELSMTHWYNIYSSLDILSSNFRDDDKSDEAEVFISDGKIKPTNISFNLVNPKALSPADYVTFLSLRAHKMYWDSNLEAKNCLSNLLVVRV